MAAQVTQAMWDQLTDRMQAIEIGHMATRNEIGTVLQQQKDANEEFKGNTVATITTMKIEIQGIVDEAKTTFALHRDELAQHQNDLDAHREELRQQQNGLK